MIKFTRMAALAAAATIAVPAVAAPTSVSNGPVTATARIVKPLTLTEVGDMDFGTIIVQDAGTITMDTAGGITCTANLTCSGPTTAARYHVTGTNNQTVQITKPPVTLTNTDLSGTTLNLTLTGPNSVLLPNSGATGIDFALGGTIAIPASQREGTYVGDLAVTVDY